MTTDLCPPIALDYGPSAKSAISQVRGTLVREEGTAPGTVRPRGVEVALSENRRRPTIASALEERVAALAAHVTSDGQMTVSHSHVNVVLHDPDYITPSQAVEVSRRSWARYRFRSGPMRCTFLVPEEVLTLPTYKAWLRIVSERVSLSSPSLTAAFIVYRRLCHSLECWRQVLRDR